MSNRLLLKSSGTADAVPDFDDLELAELVVNTRNGKMFCKTYDGSTYAIVDLTLSSPDEIIASGTGLIGRSASGSGPAALLSGADAVALLPDATSSAAGKMTAAAASKLDGISAGADATGFRGNVTTSQRDALTGLSAGHWVRNTDWPYGQNVETWSGSIWVRQGCVVLTNRYGSNLPYGCPVVPSTSYDLSVTLTNVSASNSVLGINTTPNAPNNTDAAIAVVGSGLIVDALVYAYGSVSRNEFAFSHASYGFCRGNATANVGAFGRWLTEYTAPSGGGTSKLLLTSNSELY